VLLVAVLLMGASAAPLAYRVAALEAQAAMTSKRLAKLEAQNIDLESRVEYLTHHLK
jgi:hypothetical protein